MTPSFIPLTPSLIIFFSKRSRKTWTAATVSLWSAVKVTSILTNQSPCQSVTSWPRCSYRQIKLFIDLDRKVTSWIYLEYVNKGVMYYKYSIRIVYENVWITNQLITCVDLTKPSKGGSRCKQYKHLLVVILIHFLNFDSNQGMGFGWYARGWLVQVSP